MYYYIFITFTQSNSSGALNTNVLCNHRGPTVDGGPVKALINYSMVALCIMHLYRKESLPHFIMLLVLKEMSDICNAHRNVMAS